MLVGAPHGQVAGEERLTAPGASAVAHLKKPEASGAARLDSAPAWLAAAALRLWGASAESVAAAAKARELAASLAAHWREASGTGVRRVTARRLVTAARVKVLMGEQASSRVRHIQPGHLAPGWGQYATLKLKPEC